MQSLKVQEFSCIKSADLNISRYTLLIGPQASGKSVLSKLLYFFNEVIDKQFRAIEDGTELTEFKTDISEEFTRWFPVSAWGEKKFSISFSAGTIQIKILRTAYSKKVSDTVRVTLSKSLTTFYTSSIAEFQELSGRTIPTSKNDAFDLQFKFREAKRNEFTKIAGDNGFFSNQTFIPAGRAFFTSLGRIFSAFEGNNMLDPVTTDFGRIYAAYRDPRFGRSLNGSPNKLSKALFKLLGGVPKRKDNLEFVELEDGRTVPFSALSSGQQELLPLITLLEWTANPRFRMPDAPGGDMFYIEEPEAHLFPRAQSSIVELLVSIMRSSRRYRSLLLTTHSPYVLSKINTLIKAGILSAAGEVPQEKIEQIVSIDSWLFPGDVSAYAIIDGKILSIIDQDGFIDADYLDSVSSEISNEYSALLELEFADEE